MRKLRNTLLCLLIASSHHSLLAQGYDRLQLATYLQNQDYSKAIDYLLASTPAVAQAERYVADLGYAYFLNDDQEAAKRAYLQLYQLQPLSREANLYLGEIYGQQRQSDSALFYFVKLTRIQPDNYRNWQRAGQVFSDKQEDDSAVNYLARAVALNPASGRLLVEFTNLLQRQKKAQQADELISQFLLRDSSNQDVIVKRIDLSARKPDHASVIKWGEKLLKDSADLNAPYVNLAYSYLNVDSLDKCIKLYEWMMAKNKGTQPLLYCAALAYGKKKEFVLSNNLLDACISLSIQKDAITYFDAKADNFELMKQYKNAVKAYDTSYYIFHSPADLYLAGRIYDKFFNDRVKASSYYRRFLDMQKNPRNSGEIRVMDYIREYLKPAEK